MLVVPVVDLKSSRNGLTKNEAAAVNATISGFIFLSLPWLFSV